jgi:predicted ATP-dependent protease
MANIGIDDYWNFYRQQSNLLKIRGIEIKLIGEKKNYINDLWKKEKKLRKKANAAEERAKQAKEEAERAIMEKEEAQEKAKQAKEAQEKAEKCINVIKKNIDAYGGKAKK